MSDLFERAAKFFSDYQVELCNALAELDGGAVFGADAWQRPGGGGGVARVLEAGTHLEKAGVNTFSVEDTLPETVAAQLPGHGRTFRACGISAVVHPRSPMVATPFLTFRCMARGEEQRFGGGIDLAPHYFFRDDVIHFHGALAAACDRHRTAANYDQFKAAADAYFVLPHRGEQRGIGGVHFQDLPGDEPTFDFIRDLAAACIDAYIPLVRKRATEPYGEAERLWQLRRRGRFAEFALLQDQGTLFGLATNGRVESVLLPLPPLVRWDYDPQTQPGSPEAEMLTHLRPTAWLAR